MPVTTRYAVPVKSEDGLSSEVNDHFAMSEHFAILEVKKNRIISVRFVHNRRDVEKQNNAAQFLVDRGVMVVLTGRIGSCMIRIFMDTGIKLYSGAAGTVEDAFNSYVEGKLAEVRPSPYQL
jgi:predicted Fe-Mo cluster-binding NifX family protein